MPAAPLRLPANTASKEGLERVVDVLMKHVAYLEAGQEVLAEELRTMDPHFDDPARKKARLERFRRLQSERRRELSTLAGYPKTDPDLTQTH